MLNCTKLTTDALEARGLRVVKTEHYDVRSRRSFDLLGFIDLLAFGSGAGFVAVQCTSGANLAARVTKIKTKCRADALLWIDAGGRIEVWGWRMLKGKPEPQARITALCRSDFQ